MGEKDVMEGSESGKTQCLACRMVRDPPASFDSAYLTGLADARVLSFQKVFEWLCQPHRAELDAMLAVYLQALKNV